jgi:4-hydroxy-tetrahydrodipicolinate reductase
LDANGAQVALHAVSSQVAAVETQLVALVEAGLNVVTTTEELIHPYARSEAAAMRIDAAARANGVAVFPAGVNPGILMDRLPVYLTSLCLRVRTVEARRLVDLSRRRQALRRKMGVGCPAAEVESRIANGTIGHVGLVESLLYVAACMDWRMGPITERLSPIVATSVVERAGEKVLPGCVLGLSHTVEASDPQGHRIALSLTMRLDAAEPFDEIEIDSDPPVHVRFPRGVDGDEATAATVLNAIPFAATAPPGLITRLAVPSGP